MSGTLTVSSSQESAFTKGSIMLTPKRARNGLLKNTKHQKKESTHQEIFAWTLTSDATAQCRIRDIHCLKESDKGPDFFWLGRIPCRNVRITGLLVGVSVYESRIVYTMDDGTGLVDCSHKVEEHKAKKQKLTEVPPPVPQDPVPVAVVGDFVRVVGRVIPKHGTRQLVASDIARCKSPNDELAHHQRVEQLHRDHYSSKEPFVILEVKPEPKSATPKRPVPPTPVSAVMSSPEPASSPIKPEAVPASPHRLRHPARLRSGDLTANTFRIYLKHFMDHEPPPPTLSSGDPSDEDPFSTPKQVEQRTPHASGSNSRIRHPSIEPISFPGLPPRSTTFTYDEPSSLLGYTTSYLRRVPELDFLARRVLRHEIRARVRKAREAKGTSARSSSQLSANQLKPSPKEVKRLFTHAIMQLYREGSIIMWTGPKRSLGDITGSETSGLWKTNTTATSNDTHGGNSTTLYGNSKSAIVSDLDDEILSDPEPHEESYIPLKIPYLADRIVEILPKVNGFVQKKAQAETCCGATSEQLAKFLKRDDQWRFVRQDSIDDALEFLEQSSRAWRPAKGQWDLTLL